MGMPTIAAPAAVTPEVVPATVAPPVLATASPLTPAPFVPATIAPFVPATIAPLTIDSPVLATVAPPVGIITAKFLQTPNISEATSSSTVVFVGALAGGVCVGLAALIFRKAARREHSSELLSEVLE